VLYGEETGAHVAREHLRLDPLNTPQ
jgi:hypothetical protein